VSVGVSGTGVWLRNSRKSL